MGHFPVNHPLRPAYRTLAAFIGLYALVFGIVGVTQSHDTPLFAQTRLPWVLGLRTNLAFASLSIATGAILIAAAVIGRNVDAVANTTAGTAFITVGLLALCVMQTNANYLGFSMVNCNVSFILGTLLLTAGFYGKSAPPEPSPAPLRPTG